MSSMRPWDITHLLTGILVMLGVAGAQDQGRDVAGIKPQPPSDWSVVQAVPAGTRVAIGLSEGNLIRGRLELASSDAIVLRQKGSMRRFSRGAVKLVRVRKPYSQRAWKWTLLVAGGIFAINYLWISEVFYDHIRGINELWAAGTAAPALIAGLRINRMQTIYEVK